ncbi:hypothetical protein NEHOM01_0950 [Nematocida homosporus]|uniref:uncharacterized protein n=1 Tax=Nematocida homosporus TaxID=1912981 RepID=UPI002220DCF2|nr:uncharacterized protein NEHOM01_0950 [Nematocida homosporus]KAI5185624.1 hypothetical protein NEHOM01_0950 [Nematocida homosporus]
MGVLSRQNLLLSWQVIGLISIGVVLRMARVDQWLDRVSYYDVVEGYGYQRGNPYAEEPYMLTRLVCWIVPEWGFDWFMLACDGLTAWLLNDYWYFVLGSALPVDAVGVLGLGVALAYCWGGRRGRALLGGMLVENTANKCQPGINPFWYVNIQMLDQYQAMHHQIFYATHYLFWGLSWAAQEWTTQLFMGLVFKEGGYKMYLLLWRLLAREMVMLPEYKWVFGCLEGIGALCYLLESLIWWLLVRCGVGNMNFLCWVTLIFILCSAAATLLVEVGKRDGKMAAAKAVKAKSV